MKECFNHVVALKLIFMLIYALDISYHKFFYLLLYSILIMLTLC